MLIATKLRPVAQDFLPRPHLYAALEHGRTGKLDVDLRARRTARVHLPAWLASSGHAHVWISLDPSDSDLGLSYRRTASAMSHRTPRPTGQHPPERHPAAAGLHCGQSHQ
ncbi:MAG: hypothetical protein R2838_02560 [Caldilineaceae bacterium]